MEALSVFLHSGDINDLLVGMRCNRTATLADVSALSLMWMTFFDVLLGDRVEADDVAVQRLVDIEVLILRVLHVQRGARRGEALKM